MNDQSSLPDLGCLCAGLRRAARALTQTYDEALRPVDIRGTQFTILQVLSRTGEISQGRLGQVLAMDSTTLTRTLAVLIRQGWVAERRGQDRRERLISMTSDGHDKFNSALPLWKAVQKRMRAHMGDERRDEFMRLSDEVAAHAIREISNNSNKE
jgi:DNA-binding MarR family transcriptional regulator